MATIFQTGNVTSTVTVSNGDRYVVSGSQFIAVSGGDGVVLADAPTAPQLVNMGSISADQTGVVVQAPQAVITNYGTMTSFAPYNNTVIQMTQTQNSLVQINNHGTISLGGSSGYLLQMPYDYRVEVRLLNTGTLDAERGSILVGSFGSDDNTFINSGTVHAALLVMSGWGNSTLVNTGDMVVRWLDVQAQSAFLFVNHGTLTDTDGDVYITTSRYEPDQIANSGTIFGSIDLLGGDDRVENIGNGIIHGAVYGKSGSDTLVGGAFRDEFYGGTENDVLVGRGGDDVLNGEGGDDMILAGDGDDSATGDIGADTINGGAGNDTLLGGAREDVLVGQDGADLLDGGTENDTLDGGSGNDTLLGGGANDVLRGQEGRDVLQGGNGLDFLSGGPDADVFVFGTTIEMGIGALRDQILDFEKGLDLIDLSALYAGALTFVGTAPFTGAGQVRVAEQPTGSTIVQINMDADMQPEAELRVADVHGLDAGDFIL
ncbi:calcium-binding protein [Mameliella alba]|uniref:calcium-binding protein n=1 Tax=Mameliella alba TaxID=561184 RepID=UPI000B529FB9|nr:calcium-binding protein [Mameliella alba]MBY6119126.1 M10 family metallopeptidase C-terminal domain-containing protein [Mameliella alba]OWV45211.1 hypothetical protein CDZ95_05750 [Mameliella alba]OWV66862.1 hypothetical protein CDZ97_06595 [Mameliella alba]